MVKNILKVDPVAFRYEDPDFIEGPGIFGDDDDFEWSEDDFDSAGFDNSPMDFDSDPVWGEDTPIDEDF